MNSTGMVCFECMYFSNEDTLGHGWCNKHKKECFCEDCSCAFVESTEVADIAERAWYAGVSYQREQTRRHAVEVCKQMCPSKVSRGCANLLHKRETKTTRCDGNCARVRYFINGLDKQEL